MKTHPLPLGLATILFVLTRLTIPQANAQTPNTRRARPKAGKIASLTTVDFNDPFHLVRFGLDMPGSSSARTNFVLADSRESQASSGQATSSADRSDQFPAPPLRYDAPFFGGAPAGAIIGPPLKDPRFPKALDATFTWNGASMGMGGDANWRTADNWVGGGGMNGTGPPPADSHANDLIFAGSTQTTPNMDGNYSVHSISFDSGANSFTIVSGSGNILTLYGGGITNNSANLQTISVDHITLAASQTWSATSSGKLLVTSPVALGSNTLTLSGTSTGAGEVSGVISGSGSLIKGGTNVWKLSGANTYAGGTVVNGGTLLVSNSSGSATGTGAVTVNNSGTLSGTGFINAGAHTITINGKLSPGAAASAGNPGTIHLASTAGVGALTLSSTSTLMFDLGTSKDLVALTSTGLTLGGGTLALNLGTGFNYNTTYTLFSGVSSETGSFGTVTGYDDSMYLAMFALDGTNYNISFTAVPEVSTWFGGALAVLLLGWSGAKRSRNWKVEIRKRSAGY